MKPTDQLYRGSLTTILLKLFADHKELYGYEITQKVKELSENALSLTEGALYPALHKLEADGLLSSVVRQVDNRPRKYYALTKKGRKTSALKLEEFAGYLQAMVGLLSLKKQTV